MPVNGKDEDLHGLFKEVKAKNGRKKTVAALCCYCGLSAAGRKDLVPCDYCNLSWHLDCLNPPRAKAPTRNDHNAWRCPNHVEHDLQFVDAIELTSSRQREHLHPYHRIRKPAKHLVVDTHLQRGVPNNGLVDVYYDEESEDEFDVFDQEQNGTILRLPATGIKLDFIEKVKRENAMHKAARQAERERLEIRNLQWQVQNNKHANQRLRRHTFIERQTALNLARMARGSAGVQLGGNDIDLLINQLEADAPPDVTTMMSNAPLQAAMTNGGSTGLSLAERQQLELLQQLIRRRLDAP